MFFAIRDTGQGLGVVVYDLPSEMKAILAELSA
jgi:hypothetical protein